MKSILKIFVILFLLITTEAQLTGKLSLESGFYNSVLNNKNENGYAGKLFSSLQNKYKNDNLINNTNLLISPFLLFNSDYKNIKSKFTNNLAFYNEKSVFGVLTNINYNYYQNITDINYLNYNIQPYYSSNLGDFIFEFQTAINLNKFITDSTTTLNKFLLAPSLTYKHSRELTFSANFNYEYFDVACDKVEHIDHSKGNIISAGFTLSYITKLYLQLSYRFIQYNFNDSFLKNYEHYFRLVSGISLYKNLSIYFILDMSFPIQNIKSLNNDVFNPILYSFNREQIINLKLSQLINNDCSVYLKTGYEKDNIHSDVKYSGWNLFLGTELNF